MKHFYFKYDSYHHQVLASSALSQRTAQLCLADSRLDNANWLCEKLQLNPQNSDEEIILSAYRHWGKDCVRHLIGDFAFVVYDQQKQQVFCARDQMGVKALFYYYENNILVVASHIRLLREQCHVPLNINDSEIRRLVSTDVIMNGEYSDKTVFHKIYRLTPAFFLNLQNNHCKKQRYWQLADKTIHYNNEETYIEEFRFLLKQAINCRIKEKDKISCELSGGIDSSLTTAFAAKQTNNLIAFTHSANKESHYLDETHFAYKLCQYAHISQHQIINEKDYDLYEAIKYQIDHYCLPLRINNPLLSLSLIKAAKKEKCNIILSGFGGDECVSGHGSLLHHELAQQGQWRKLWHDIQISQTKKRNTLNTFLRQYIKAKLLILANMQKKSKNVTNRENLIIHPNVELEQHLFTQNNLNYPTIKQLEKNLLQGKNCWHLRHRIEGANLFANIFNIEYRFPLLDIRLLEFCLNLPATMKKQGDWGRYIARKAMQGFVPEELQWRHDKAGSPVPAALYKSKELGVAKQLVKSKVQCKKTQAILDLHSPVINHKNLNFYTFRNLLNALQLQLLYNEVEKIKA